MAQPRTVDDNERAVQAALRDRVNGLLAAGDSALWLQSDFSFLDIETTGMDPEVDRIVEIGIVRSNKGVITEFSTLVNPGIEIPATLSAVHHITDEMVVGAPAIGEIVDTLKEFIGDSEIVAFKASFDSSFVNPLLGRPVNTEGAATNGWICALRLARHLWPDAPGYSNQVLRYFFKSKPKNAGLGAHRALDDVYVSMETFRRQLAELTATKGLKNLSEVKAFADMPVDITHMPFGKHADEALTDIPDGYFDWAEKNMTDLDWDLQLSMDRERARRRGSAEPVAPATIMTWGRKYADKPLAVVPTDYLMWLMGEVDAGKYRLDQGLQLGIDHELAIRRAAPATPGMAAPDPLASAPEAAPTNVQSRPQRRRFG